MSKGSWPSVPFLEAVSDESRGHLKIKKADYRNVGALAVVDQGKGLIGGFTDDEAAASHVQRPVIIFGDHTRAVKYVDFPFAVGADGVKVLKPLPGVNTRYLYHYMRTLKIIDGGYSRHFKYLKEAQVPLPPIEEQRRIAAVLDAADELRDKRREALAKLATLTQAIFIDMFGAPGDNPRRWPVQPLIELVDPERPITYGILKPGQDVPDGVPYVRVVDMAGGRVLEGALRRTTPEIAHQYRRSTLAEGDLLLSIRGHVGRMAQVHGELTGANITQDTARLAIVGARPEYVFACMQAEESRRWMANFTKGAAVRGINLTDVKKFPVPVPPADLQGEFGKRAALVTAYVERCAAPLTQLDALFASLQQRAFRGEL